MRHIFVISNQIYIYKNKTKIFFKWQNSNYSSAQLLYWTDWLKKKYIGINKNPGELFTAVVIYNAGIHTGDKPYDFGVCGKKYSRRDTVESHMRTHADCDMTGVCD